MKKWFVALALTLLLCCGVSATAYAYNLTFAYYPDVEVDTSYTVIYEDGKYIYTLIVDAYGCRLDGSSIIYWSDDENLVGNGKQREVLGDLHDGNYKWFYDVSPTHEIYTITLESDELLYDESGEFGIVVNLGIKPTSEESYSYYFMRFDSSEPIPDGMPTDTPTPTPSPTVAPTPKVTLDVSVDGSSVVCDYYTGGMESVQSVLEFYWATDGMDSTDDTSFDVDVVTFVDGSGTYTYDSLKDGEYYYFKLDYTYDVDGEELTKTVYSDFFQAVVEDDVVVPSPTPELRIDYNVNGLDIVATGYTGGMDSYQSIVSVVWCYGGKENWDIESEPMADYEYVDGSGSVSFEGDIGEWYYCQIQYWYYDDSGQLQYENLVSDVFQITSSYNPFANLHSIMRWIWDDLFEVEITYEGYTVSFKQIFMFGLVAPLVIFFVMAALGVNFLGGGDTNKPKRWDYFDSGAPRLEDKKKRK